MARRDLEERPLLAGLAWAAALIAVAVSVWLVGRAQRPAPLPTAVLPSPPVAATAAAESPSGVTPAVTAVPDEVTHEERRALEDVLRRKGAGQMPR